MFTFLGLFAGALALLASGARLVAVRGDSLAGALEAGDTVLVMKAGARLRTGDLVIAQVAGGPALKIFTGVTNGGAWLTGTSASSRDSRQFGPVALDMVREKAVARLWPRPCLLPHDR